MSQSRKKIRASTQSGYDEERMEQRRRRIEAPPADRAPRVFWWVHRSIAPDAPTYGEYALMCSSLDPTEHWDSRTLVLHGRYDTSRTIDTTTWGEAITNGLIRPEVIRSHRQRAVSEAAYSGALQPASAVEEMYALQRRDDARAAGVGA